MKRTCGLLLFGLVLGGAGCQPPPPNTKNVVVTGSVVMAPLVQDIANRFEATHPGVRIDVQRGVSDRGIEDTQRGLADIGMVARGLRAKEMALHAHPIALDGLCLIVHKSNPLQSLNNSQIIGIYTRQLTNWKQLGGPNQPILTITQTDGTALATLFQEHFNFKAGQVRADRTATSNAECMHLVARQPGAIGYVSISARESPDSDPGVHPLAYEGVPATLANVRNGSYLLSRPLNLVTREEPTDLVKEFIDFARSPAVVDLVEKMHFVPVAPEPAEPTGPAPKAKE
jgi:phosphate transport system substrate-binding protein